MREAAHSAASPHVHGDLGDLVQSALARPIAFDLGHRYHQAVIQDGIPPLGEDLLYAVVFEDELFEDFGAWVLFLPVSYLPSLTSSAAVRLAGRAKYAIKVEGFGLVPAVVALNKDRDFIQLTEWRRLVPDSHVVAWAAVVTTRLGL